MPFDGMQLGNYRLLRLIGRGGMGEVYVAEDVRTPRQIAVKIARIEPQPLTPSDTFAEVSRLFHREMQVIISLDHPNILPLIDFGETVYEQQSTLLYIVMPYRPEGSLANWLTRQNLNRPLTLRDAANFVMQAADALQHAHDHHIVHQDVKLANFLVREHHNRPRHPDILLTDFGIARITSTNSTQSQQFRGTPSAMPPEQWDSEPVTASDQYALAVMAYQLLTGRAPFIGSPEQVMRQHFTKQPAPPSHLNPLLPPGVDDAILQALAKSPEQRHSSVLAFAQALQHFSYEPPNFSLTPIFSQEGTIPTPTDPQLTPVMAPSAISQQQSAITPETVPQPQPVTALQTVLPASEYGTPQQTTIGPFSGGPLLPVHSKAIKKPRIRTLIFALLALLLIVPAGIIAANHEYQAHMLSTQATATAIQQTNLAHQRATSAAATAQVTFAAATATMQANAACYNQSVSLGPYALSDGIYLLPSQAPWFSTSSACHSINVKFSQLTAPIQMQVCFIDAKNCNAWMDMNNANQWYLLATNIPDQATYRFGLKSTRETIMQVMVAD